MRFIVFSHKLFRNTPRGLQTNGAFTVQMDALAAHFDEVTLCVPVVDDDSFRGVSITAPNIRFHSLPHYDGRLGFIRALPALRREILAAMKQTDAGLVILPGYFGSLASWLCQKQGFPIFQWVVGDWSRNVRARRGRSLAGRWAAVWTPLLDWLTARLTRDVLTFFNGRILYQPQPHHFTRVSSSIRDDDIFERQDAAAGSPPHRLLFVGRLAAEKGVNDLLQAVSLMRDDVVLHLVGDGELAGALRQTVADLSLEEQTHFHGFVPHGAALRRLFRDSDLFILPALQDQQPKVLMEAMSQSVPVIATNVGGIPSIVRDGENGLLIPPAQPEALVTAVRRLLTDNDLRRRFIQNGLAHVRQRTVKAETARMMQTVSAHFGWPDAVVDEGGLG
ncbi:MAG: glycosyltransferase family 4 protein [Chloroflexi bacterium]|nr:glycosyltransferase family 4 protein [Chloroflexota bacterium]